MKSERSTQPARIGKYHLLSTLGEGAMGIVYLAHDPFIDRRVALKTVHKELLAGDQGATLAARFRQEATAAGRLSHPGIVAVYDYGEDERRAYIVMEYAPGENLADHAKRHRLSLPEIGGLMAELLDALQYAHDAGVVHRDIKPSNLILSAGRLKITDFGIARLSTSDLTQSGMIIGTPSYMAPEQYAGGPVDHRADLFAAGVLLYKLLTRRLPFKGAGMQEVGYQVCHVEPPPPSALAPHLPRALDEVMAKALAKQKEARFASARDLARAIAAALSGADAEVRVVSLPPPASLPSPGSLPPPASSVLASGVQPVPRGWAPEALRALESTLTPVMGAIAGPLVRRSAAKTRDPEQLVALLAGSVDDPAARTGVERSLRAALGAPPTATAAEATGPTTARSIGEQTRGFTPEDLERLTRVLAGSIGPIARILVQKASTQAKSYRELCVRVSERLATPEERARFLAQVDAA